MRSPFILGIDFQLWNVKITLAVPKFHSEEFAVSLPVVACQRYTHSTIAVDDVEVFVVAFQLAKELSFLLLFLTNERSCYSPFADRLDAKFVAVVSDRSFNAIEVSCQLGKRHDLAKIDEFLLSAFKYLPLVRFWSDYLLSLEAELDPKDSTVLYRRTDAAPVLFSDRGWRHTVELSRVLSHLVAQLGILVGRRLNLQPSVNSFPYRSLGDFVS